MRNPEKFKRYLRVDSESLSMLLAKVTLTTCYGIPRKGEPGYISEDENVDSPEVSTKSKVEKWNIVDPLGSIVPAHHTDPGYQVPDEGKCMPLDDDSTPTAIGVEFKAAVVEIGQKTKASIDKDLDVEKEFFRQAEGKIPRLEGNDPAFMTTPTDVFKALPEELDVIPNNRYEVRSPRAQAPEPPRPRVAPTKRATSAALGAEEQDRTRWRRQRFEAQGRARDRGTDDDDDQRPGPREMPPPQAPPARRVTAREETRLPHSEVELLRVTGRSRFANQMRMPLVLRMKHTVPSDDLGNPTIEQLYRMYNDESSIPIVRQQAAELIVKLNVLPTDEMNMVSAGLTPTGQRDRAPSPASTATSPAEDINPGFQGTSGRTASRLSRQPQKFLRDDNWVPTMTRGVPLAMSDAPAPRGREPRRADESHSEPAQPTGVMGVAKNTSLA